MKQLDRKQLNKPLVLKQLNTGSGLGMMKDLGSRTMFYLSFINFIQISISSYDTSFRIYLAQWAPWLSSNLYFISLLTVILLIGVFEYFIVMPSSFNWLNSQEYKHQNLIKVDIEKVSKEQTKQGKDLENIKKTLEDIRRGLNAK